MTLSRHDLSPERSVLGGGRSARTLEPDTAPEPHPGFTGPPRGTLVARAPAPRKKGSHGGGSEINIVGSFPNPFKKDLAKEIDAMKNGRWEPSIDDFAAVGGSVVVCDSFAQVSSAILFSTIGSERKSASINRINIFTHANSDLIAFQGKIQPLAAVGATVTLDTGTGLTASVLQTWNAPSFFLTVPSKQHKRFTLKDVQARFTGRDARIVIYACHSGVDGLFLQEIADTFQVTVAGFKDVIAYCPKWSESPLAVDRKRVAVKTCADPQSDFHTLAKKAGDLVVKTPR